MYMDLWIAKGDWNVRLIKLRKVKETTIGKHPPSGGVRNDKGERFMNVCSMNDLVMTTTVSPDRDIQTYLVITGRQV